MLALVGYVFGFCVIALLLGGTAVGLKAIWIALRLKWSE